MRRVRLLTFAMSACLTLTGVGWAQTVGPAAVTPAVAPVGVGTPVTVTAVITDPGLIPASLVLQRIDSAGRVLATMGSLVDDGTAGDAAAGDRTFTGRPTLYELAPGPVILRVSAAFQGRVTRVLSAPLTVSVQGTSATLTITSPANLAFLSVSPTSVRGTVGSPQTAVTINGVPAVVTGNTFSAQVPLLEGTNTLVAVGQTSGGTASTASVQVTLDTTPPQVSVNSPEAGFVTSEATVNVSGLVNDIVVGTVNPLQATVTVNGVAAAVANRSFLVSNLPLALGPNTIRAIATDRSGNSRTASFEVTRVPVTGGAISRVTGNAQSGAIGSVLPAPLVVKVTNGTGQPAASVPVVFRVTENSGVIIDGSAEVGSLAVDTDPQGLARVRFRLGSRSGVGNNVIEANATGFQGTAVFTHSATSTGAAQIVVDTGNGQTGVVGQSLPLPFIAIVADAGHNRVAGVPVTFTVRQGGGVIGGKPLFTGVTDSDGRVAALLTLGQQEGFDNNVVEATFTGNPGLPAAFLASARVPGNPSATRISGVVLDNAGQPIPEVTLRLFRTHHGTGLPEQVVAPVESDDDGHFVIQPAPVGAYKLMADGSTAPNGPWPTLEFDLVTVAGRDNDVGLPIYLPRLDATNRLCVSETTGGTLTLPQVPGFALTIAAGSATFPGGARSGCVSVTPVNGDKVPMSPGFGQQPRFVVTIQPVGTVFNPPAQITLPNVDGLAPRAVTEMYSYDHDLAAFVSIGTGTVSEDGSVIASDPGVGVIKAGWHCGGNPNPVGSAGECGECAKCVGTQCQKDPAKDNNTCNGNAGCCKDGRCQAIGGTTAPSVGAFNYRETITAPTTGDYGLTTPANSIDIDVGAIADAGAGVWRARLIKADMPYSIWYRIFGHQSEPNVAGITTRDIACKMKSDLNSLGVPAASTTTYMVSAVEAHEREHVKTLKNSVNPEFAALKASVEGITVPFSCSTTPAQAITQLKAAAAYQAAINTANTNWITVWNVEQGVDHNPGGRADQAEQNVVNPVIAQIDKLVASNGWVACP